jgi:hypothetical protein
MKAEEVVSSETICIVTGKYVQILNAQRNLQEIVVSKSWIFPKKKTVFFTLYLFLIAIKCGILLSCVFMSKTTPGLHLPFYRNQRTPEWLIEYLHWWKERISDEIP